MIRAALELVNAGFFWKLGFFIFAVVVIVWLARLQRHPDNGVNFLELVLEPGTERMDPVRVAYMTTLALTAIGYVYFFMTVALTPEGFALVTGTFAGIWVMSQGANKALGRPVTPVVNPPAPAVGINIGNQQGPA